MFEKIKNGQTHLVFPYVEAGHSPHASDAYGVSLIKWCAHYGDVSAIRYLLSIGVTPEEMGENFDLNGAVYHGHLQLTTFVLEQGADANYPMPDTAETPLHAILTKTNRPANFEVVRLLLEYGANPNARTTPNIETDHFMRDIRTRAETPLHRAAAYADAKTIQLLLDAGADKTIQDMNGDSPLTWASWHLRDREILKLLCYGKYHVR